LAKLRLASCEKLICITRIERDRGIMFWRKKLPEEEKADEFRKLLKEKDVNKRLSAISSLTDVGSRSPQIFPSLLQDRDIHVCSSAAFAISSLISSYPELREELVRKAMELLKHRDYRMQRYAASLLGRVAAHFPELIKDLLPEITPLAKEGDVAYALAVREIGIQAPQLIEDMMPTMTQALEGKKNAIRAALIALERISWKSPVLLRDSMPHLLNIVRKTDSLQISVLAAGALTNISMSSPDLGKQLVWPLVEDLMEKKKEVARTCVSLMVWGVGLAHPELVMNALPKIAKLSEDDVAIGMLLGLGLGRIGSQSRVLAEKVTPELLKFVNDPHPAVRVLGIIGLRYVAQISPKLVKAVVPDLSKMLEHKDATVRGTVAIGLKLISLVSPDILQDVVEMVSDVIAEGNIGARHAAAAVFNMIAKYYDPTVDEGVIPEIAGFLGDEDSKVRDQALLAIKNIALRNPSLVKEWVPQVAKLLEDKNETVRRHATWALEEVAVDHPELVKETALSKIIMLLDDKSVKVRMFAALSLGKLI
jgi:HEAT repeat protein